MSNNFDLYDKISTQAARWVIWNFHNQKKPVGISNFDRKDKSHLWLLHIMNICRISNAFDFFYIECSFIDYLIMRYIKGFKYIRRARGDVFLIDPKVFIYEVCKYCEADASVINEIYDEYWSK